MNHTPTPWKVTGEKERPHWIQTLDNHPIAAFNFKGDGNQKANAAFIVTACNAHEELIRAVKLALEVCPARYDRSLKKALTTAGVNP